MTIGLNLISINNRKIRGTTKFLLNIINSFSEFNLSQCKFIVYKQKHIPEDFFDFPSEISVKWINVPSIGGGLKRILFEQTIFYKYLKNCDVLFSHCTSLPLFASSKKVFTLHDVYYKEYKNRYSKFKTIILDLITKLHIQKADKIITVSKYSKKSILKYYNVHKEKIEVIPNFLIPNKIPKNSSISVPLEIIQRSFLFVGSIQPGKNIEGMIEGFQIFSKKNPEYYLIIVGRPAFKGDEIIKKIPSEARIIYLGYQSEEAVKNLQKTCFATVLLSFCEGFGIPPLEGFYYSKPTLVSNVTSLPEVVGEAGVCVNPYNSEAIANGYKSIVEQYEILKHKTQERVDYYDRQKIMREFFRVLDIPYSNRLKN